MAEIAKSGKERLKQIAKKKNGKIEGKAIDWEKKKQDWLDQLSLLYKGIEQWLNDVEGIKIQRQQIWISEEYIGRYQVDRLLVYVGDNLITFTPRGTIIIAARGRIDVHSSNNKRSMIVLQRKGERPKIIVTINSETPPPKPEPEIAEYEWLIVNEKRRKEYIVLNEDTFTVFIADLIEKE